MSSEETLPFILRCGYFKVINISKEKNVSAKCLLCKSSDSKNEIYKAAVTATSNLLLHLKRKHPEVINNYEKIKTEDRKVKKFLPAKASSSVLPFKVINKSVPLVDKLIMNFIIKGMHPLSMVEQKEFIELVEGLNNNATVMSRRKLTNLLGERCTSMKNEISSRLSQIQYLCLTADAWTCKGMSRSFMGVTIHWITEQFERKSYALACRRFPGSHTHQRIAALLTSIMKEYNLSVKQIVKAVTDNGANFLAAFKAFQVRSKLTQNDENEELEDNEDEDDSSISFVDMESTLIEPIGFDGGESVYELPPHQRCAAHTLSLICTKDIADNLPRSFKSAIAKCQGLWNKMSRSTAISENVKLICGSSLPKPCVTRWNSLFDSIMALLKLENKLDEIMAAGKMKQLSEMELVSLKEYVTCVDPLAKALDKLQGEEGVFYGNLVPCLFKVKERLESLQISSLQECKNLPSQLLHALNERFEHYLTLDLNNEDTEKSAIIAAVSHPFFKLRWAAKDRHVELQELFLTAVFEDSNRPSEPRMRVATSKPIETDDFFDFGDVEMVDGSEEMTALHVQEECLKYLHDSNTSLSMLNKYLSVKNVFMKFNTPLPSSAPVERLFNYANMILRPNRRRLTDSNFELLTLLKVN